MPVTAVDRIGTLRVSHTLTTDIRSDGVRIRDAVVLVAPEHVTGHEHATRLSALGGSKNRWHATA